MKWFLAISLLIILGLAQFNMSVFSRLPSKKYTSGLTFGAIRKNSTEALLSVSANSTYKIVKWNIANNSTVAETGAYTASGVGQNTTYGYLFFFQGYLMGCSAFLPCRVWNQSTQQFVGSLSLNLTFGRGQYLSLKNVFFFGSAAGSYGYFDISTLPTIHPNYLFQGSNTSEFVFMQKSNDEQYVSASFKSAKFINIWRVSDWTMVKNITVSSSGVYTQIWSPDNKYLLVFLFNELYAELYDCSLNWTFVKNVTIGHKNIRTAFIYLETNTIVALSEGSKAVISINWYDFSVSYISAVTDGFKMYRSDDEQMMTIFQQSPINTAWFFNIHPYCQKYTLWDIPSKSCATICGSNCQTCYNETFCDTCNTNYALQSNGKCVTCGAKSIYNPTTKVCDSCGTDCNVCSSADVCTQCILPAILINGSCVTCPLNCVTCVSSSQCLECEVNYELSSLNLCQQCNSSAFYNSTSLKCEVIQSGNDSSNITNVTCPDGEYFNSSSNICESCSGVGQVYWTELGQCIANCTPNCLACSSVTQCGTCQFDFTLYQGNCLSSEDYQLVDDSKNGNSSDQTANNTSNNDEDSESSRRYNTLYEITMGLTVQNQVVSILNKVPASRRLLRQVFGIFLNIDHLWLYIYHNRQYGYYVNRLLQAVRNLQQQKWNLFSDDLLNNTLHIDITGLSASLDTKLNSTSAKYLQIQNQSASFFQNSLDYFLLNVPLVIITFLFFKFLFFLLFRFEISKLFREYAFNGYLLLMLFEGNAESFSYLFMFDSLQIKGITFWEKAVNTLTILMFAVFVAHIIGGFFVIKSTYNRYAKYLYDNCSNTLPGSVVLLIQYGMLNFLLGSAHILLQYQYNLQLLALFIIQISFILIITFSIHWNKRNLFEYKYIQWMNLIASLIRICLILTYYCDQNSPGKYQPLDEAQMYLIIIYLFNWIIYTVLGYLLTIISLIRFIIKKISLMSEEKKSLILENPYLKRFYNLARKQKKKKNVQIQTIDFTSPVQNNKKAFKMQICLNGGNNKESISIVHKIKLYKNQPFLASSNQKEKTFSNKESEEIAPWKSRIHKTFAKQRQQTIINQLKIQLNQNIKPFNESVTEKDQIQKCQVLVQQDISTPTNLIQNKNMQKTIKQKIMYKRKNFNSHITQFSPISDKNRNDKKFSKFLNQYPKVFQTNFIDLDQAIN